jgi:hypothetical protein
MGPIHLLSVAEFQQHISAGHSLVRTRLVRQIGYMAPNSSFRHDGPV